MSDTVAMSDGLYILRRIVETTSDGGLRQYMGHIRAQGRCGYIDVFTHDHLCAVPFVGRRYPAHDRISQHKDHQVLVRRVLGFQVMGKLARGVGLICPQQN